MSSAIDDRPLRPGVPQTRISSARRRTRAAITAHPGVVAGVGVLTLMAAVAVLAPLIEPYSVNGRSGPVFGSPSRSHWLGLDDGGVDVLSVLIAGTRASLLTGFGSTFLAIFIGVSLGVMAGYQGGIADGIIMRVTDYFLVIPTLPLTIVMSALWGSGIIHTIIILGALLWPWSARIVRAQVTSGRERLHVVRARAMGASRRRIVVHHVMPQLIGLVIASAVITFASAIFLETALDFLGLGDSNTVTWGTMLENAFQRSAVSAGAWWAVLPPGLTLTVTIVACYLVGEGVELAVGLRGQLNHFIGGARAAAVIEPASVAE